MNLRRHILPAAVAGFIATGPMTLVMALLKRWLPWWQKSPLPPHQVTSGTLERAGLEKLDKSQHQLATAIGHFGYGAGAGVLYPLVHRLPGSVLLRGTVYGLGVWTASYMGWLPAVGLLDPATERPTKRNLLMIAAHVVWGTATGVIYMLIIPNKDGNTSQKDNN